MVKKFIHAGKEYQIRCELSANGEYIKATVFCGNDNIYETSCSVTFNTKKELRTYHGRTPLDLTLLSLEDAIKSGKIR
ncbi:MAG: hypothetical protein ABSE97_01070 [Verrucomicrobiota bacterium]|jgi:hypothetical protein